MDVPDMYVCADNEIKCAFHDTHLIDCDAPGIGGTGKIMRTSHQSQAVHNLTRELC